MTNMKKLQDALDKMADLYEYGHLQLSADPVGFLEDVISEIKELRKERHELMLRLDSFDEEESVIEDRYQKGEVFVHLNDDVISEIKELRKERHEIMLRLDSYDEEFFIEDRYQKGEHVFVHLNDDAGSILASVEPYSCPGDWINSFSLINNAESYIKEKGYKYDRTKDFYCTLSPNKRTTYERFAGKIPEPQKLHPLETE